MKMDDYGNLYYVDKKGGSSIRKVKNEDLIKRMTSQDNTSLPNTEVYGANNTVAAVNI